MYVNEYDELATLQETKQGLRTKRKVGNYTIYTTVVVYGGKNGKQSFASEEDALNWCEENNKCE